MIFIDTNYFLRFLLEDNNSQYLITKELFLDGAKGKINLTTSIIVFFEIYWVFKSYYEKNKTEILEILQKILKMDFIEFDQKGILEKALEIFNQTNLSLEDSYNLAFAKEKGVNQFKTFDQLLVKNFKK